MTEFSGLEIKPYSQLTDLPRVKIDRVRVEVQRTLFGDIEYHLVGTMGDEGRAWPADDGPRGRLGSQKGSGSAHLQGARGGKI